MFLEISAGGWALLAVAAIIVGISKTALPGAATLSVAIFAGVLPSRASTATLLVLLIVGDVFALWAYRRHADWRTLWRLAPAVIAGLLVGAVFLALADDVSVRRVIGVILLVLVAITLWRRKVDPVVAPSRSVAVAYGSLGGFTTMVANAGGPVMSMYFLAAIGPAAQPFMEHLTKRRRIGAYFPIVAALTILAGAALYWRDSNGLDSAWISSPSGLAFTIGGVAAIVAFVGGMILIGPSAAEQAAVQKELAANGGAPSGAHLERLAQADRRMRLASRIDLPLLLLAGLTMAVGRYL